jgi:hypothetical protein
MGGEKVLLMTLVLGGGEWFASLRSHALLPGERTPSTHWIGGCVGLRASLDTEARGEI